jgi:primosomal protein N' (replication factor Y)
VGPDRRVEEPGHTLTSPTVVRVVPDLATFAVDDGFAYAVPPGIEVGVGSLVRVPLAGRRVRGYVVAVDEPSRRGLRQVLGRSGDLAVFGPGLLEVMRWAAIHYVAPLAVVLGKAAPPNLPRRVDGGPFPPGPALGPSPLPEVSEAAACGGHLGARYLLGAGPWAGPLAAVVAPVLDAGRSAVVVVPSVAEARRYAADLGRLFGERVVVGVSEEGGAAATAAWEAMSRPGRLLVGTREAAFWPVAGLALACIVDEGRRGMKDRATPTTHARDVLWHRSAVERFPLVLCGAVPTTEALHRAPALTHLGGRPWGLVEVVDRTEEPPGGGLIGERGRRALRAVVASGGRAFILAERRAPALRCVGCRSLRLCAQCGSRPEGGGSCVRCGAALGGCPQCGGRRFEPLGAAVGRLIAEAGGFLGRDVVGEAASRRRVVVGTERDLADLSPVDLALVVDADGLLRAPHYRAVEDGLRLLARVAGAAGPGRGRRALVQTADPGHPALVALRRADPLPLLEGEAALRAAAGFPPAGEVIVVEATGAPEGADGAMREAVGGRGEVHGPAERAGRVRWLLQGRDLRGPRLMLRRLVQDWRDGGARVRIDADPIDL